MADLETSNRSEAPVKSMDKIFLPTSGHLADAKHDDDVTSGAIDGPTVARWTVHPAAQKPLAAVFAVIVTLAFGGIVAVTFGDWTWQGAAWGWGACAVAALVASQMKFWVPTTFIVGFEYIEAHSVLSRSRSPRWGDVRRFVNDERGGLLARRAIPSRWEAVKGSEFTVLLPDDEQERRFVCQLIRHRIESAHRSLEAERGIA